MGRPKQDVKREKCRFLCLTINEDFIIQEKARKAGLPVNTYIRNLALYTEVRPVFTKEEWGAVRELIAMSNKLDRLVRIASQEGVLNAVLHFEFYRDRIDELLNRLKHVK